MDEKACLWKQLKWNKYPLYSDKLSDELITGINIARQRVWETHLARTKSPDKLTGCPVKLL